MKLENGARPALKREEIRRFLICILFASFHFGVSGQNNYRVSYADDFSMNLNLPTTNATWVTRTTRKEKLVSNDSICFSYIVVNNQDLMKKKTVYGQTMIHHGFLYNHNSKLKYEMVAWPPGKQNRYLIMDTLTAGNWIFLPESKKILDYSCQSAISIYNQNDTTRVWYTTELPYSFGPRGYVGFPGLVLEVINSNYNRLLVTKIEKGNFPIALPVGIPIISSEEAIERRMMKGAVNKSVNSPTEGKIYKTKRQKRDSFAN